MHTIFSKTLEFCEKSWGGGIEKPLKSVVVAFVVCFSIISDSWSADYSKFGVDNIDRLATDTNNTDSDGNPKEDSISYLSGNYFYQMYYGAACRNNVGVISALLSVATADVDDVVTGVQFCPLAVKAFNELLSNGEKVFGYQSPQSWKPEEGCSWLCAEGYLGEKCEKKYSIYRKLDTSDAEDYNYEGKYICGGSDDPCDICPVPDEGKGKNNKCMGGILMDPTSSSITNSIYNTMIVNPIHEDAKREFVYLFAVTHLYEHGAQVKLMGFKRKQYGNWCGNGNYYPIMFDVGAREVTVCEPGWHGTSCAQKYDLSNNQCNNSSYAPKGTNGCYDYDISDDWRQDARTRYCGGLKCEYDDNGYMQYVPSDGGVVRCGPGYYGSTDISNVRYGASNNSPNTLKWNKFDCQGCERPGWAYFSDYRSVWTYADVGAKSQAECKIISVGQDSNNGTCESGKLYGGKCWPVFEDEYSNRFILPAECTY